MAKHRDFDDQDVFYASWTDAIQEFVGTLSANVQISCPTATSIRVSAGPGSSQVAIGIEGKWRYRSDDSSITLSGAAATYDIHAVAVTDNNFTGAGNDPDNTDYNFELRQVASGGEPNDVAAYRKIAEVDWDGAKITGVRQVVGLESATQAVAPQPHTINSHALRVRGLAGQVEDIGAIFDSTGTKLFGIGPAGQLTLVNGAIQTAHIGNNQITAEKATTASAGSIQPDDTAATGTSSSLARADHRHSISAAAPSSNLSASTTNTEGSSTSFARADHSHSITTGTPSSNLSASTTNTEGSAAGVARADHSHAITTGTASTISGVNGAGVSANIARADHDHALGTNVVTHTQLRDDTTTDSNRAVTTNHIRNRAVTADKMAAQTVQTETASIQLAPGDAWKLLRMDSSSTLYVDVVTGTAFAVGERIDVARVGSGDVIFRPFSVTISHTPGLKLRAQHSAATLICVDTNSYLLIGDLAV